MPRAFPSLIPSALARLLSAVALLVLIGCGNGDGGSTKAPPDKLTDGTTARNAPSGGVHGPRALTGEMVIGVTPGADPLHDPVLVALCEPGVRYSLELLRETGTQCAPDRLDGPMTTLRNRTRTNAPVAVTLLVDPATSGPRLVQLVAECARLEPRSPIQLAFQRGTRSIERCKLEWPARDNRGWPALPLRLTVTVLPDDDSQLIVVPDPITPVLQPLQVSRDAPEELMARLARQVRETAADLQPLIEFDINDPGIRAGDLRNVMWGVTRGLEQAGRQRDHMFGLVLPDPVEPPAAD